MLSARRRHLGLSQEQAAVGLGTTAYTFGKWENERDWPRKMEWIQQLAEWLDVDELAVFRATIAVRDRIQGPDPAGASVQTQTRGQRMSGHLGGYTPAGTFIEEGLGKAG